MFPINREATQKRKIISNQGIFEELPLCHKVKQWFESKADDGDIGPVLVFRKNDGGPVFRKCLPPLGLNPIKNGENQVGHPFGHGIDDGISFQHRCPNQCQSSKLKCRIKSKSPMSNPN
jgi:hypothetical protein